jgi:O-antigen ligase
MTPPLDQAVARDWWRAAAPAPARPAAVADVRSGRGSATAFWGLTAFTAILLLAPQLTLLPALKPLRIALLAALIAATAHLADWFGGRRPLLPSTPAIRLSVCLLIWTVITIPASQWPGGSVALVGSLYLKALTVFWLLGAVIDGLPRLRQLLFILSLITIPLAATAVHHFETGMFIPLAGPNADRIVGYDAPLSKNPNDLALLLNLVLPLTIALWLTERRALVRWGLAGIAGLDMAAIVVTYSRAGFLTLVAIAGLYLWRARDRFKPHWLFWAVILVLASVPLVPTSYSRRLDTILHKNQDPTGSAQARWRDSIAAAKYVVGHPLIGAGAGMDALALNEVRGPRWVKVHDIYLEYAVDLGLPGLVMFLLLLRACLKAARRTRRDAMGRSDLAELAQIANGISISLAAFVVSAFFYPDAYEFFFYYVAGLAVAVREVYRCQASGTPPGEPGVEPVLQP